MRLGPSISCLACGLVRFLAKLRVPQIERTEHAVGSALARGRFGGRRVCDRVTRSGCELGVRPGRRGHVSLPSRAVRTVRQQQRRRHRRRCIYVSREARRRVQRGDRVRPDPATGRPWKLRGLGCCRGAKHLGAAREAECSTPEAGRLWWPITGRQADQSRPATPTARPTPFRPPQEPPAPAAATAGPAPGRAAKRASAPEQRLVLCSACRHLFQVQGAGRVSCPNCLAEVET
jgi:hypothetical protein